MKIEINQTTLIDQVEDSLLTYFKKNDLGRGDSIPGIIQYFFWKSVVW